MPSERALRSLAAASSIGRGATAVLIAAAAVLGLGALACAGGAFFVNTFVPTNYDLVLRNATDEAITDVRLLRNDVELATFPRIAARGTALAHDAGTGRFSLEFSDVRGRWIAHRVIWRDDDDCYGREPRVVSVQADRVNDAPVQARR